MNYLLGSLLFAEGNENDALGFLLKAEAAADYAREATETAARVRQLRKGRGLPTEQQDAEYDAISADPRPAPATSV